MQADPTSKPVVLFVEPVLENMASRSPVSSICVDDASPSTTSRAYPPILSAAIKGGLAVLGQGMFAGANFIANVLLARWLAPDEYGAFAVAYSCFLLFLMIYSACIYEPLIVFGSGTYAKHFEEYFGILVRANILALAALGGIMLLTALLLKALFPIGVERNFLALSLASPFILLTWLARGGFYAQVKPGRAAWGAFLYVAILLPALALLRMNHKLSGATAFFGMGFAGLVSAVYLFTRQPFRWKLGHDGPRMTQVAREHWKYGRWALLAALAAWFPQNIYYSILPANKGLESVAGLRALTNLTNPLLQTLTALAAVLIPSLVLQLQHGGSPRLQQSLKRITLLLVPGSIVYCGAVWFGRSVLFMLLYSGRYQQYNGLPLLLTAFTPVCATAAMISASALRALQRPECVFWSYVAATVVAVVAGFPLAIYGGVSGATVAIFLSSIAAAITMVWSLLRVLACDATI